MAEPVVVSDPAGTIAGVEGERPRTVKRAVVLRVYPTAKQRDRLEEMLAAHCELYNAALEERREAWKRHRVSIGYAAQSRQLPAIRAERPTDVGCWSAHSQQQTLRRLDKAFQAFFRRVKVGEAPGYPRFRSRDRFDSVSCGLGNGASYVPPAGSCRDGGGWGRLSLKSIGTMKVLQHRPLPPLADQLLVTVKRTGRGRRAKWWLIIPVDQPVIERPASVRQIGLDVGVRHLATLSEPIPGVTDEAGHIAHPRHLAAAQERLAAAQQALSRCQRGSARRRLARERVAAIHAQVRRQRQDTLHKLSRALVDAADLIVVEDIRTANLTRAPKPVPDPDVPGRWSPNGAAAKAGLNRSILDAGWSTFLDMIDAKAEEAGRHVIRVNPALTSRTCHQCGTVKGSLSLAERSFTCAGCGQMSDRDVNAARTILRAGTALREAATAA